jgi:hypothetical protein
MLRTVSAPSQRAVRKRKAEGSEFLSQLEEAPPAKMTKIPVHSRPVDSDSEHYVDSDSDASASGTKRHAEPDQPYRPLTSSDVLGCSSVVAEVVGAGLFDIHFDIEERKRLQRLIPKVHVISDMEIPQRRADIENALGGLLKPTENLPKIQAFEETIKMLLSAFKEKAALTGLVLNLSNAKSNDEVSEKLYQLIAALDASVRLDHFRIASTVQKLRKIYLKNLKHSANDDLVHTDIKVGISTKPYLAGEAAKVKEYMQQQAHYSTNQNIVALLERSITKQGNSSYLFRRGRQGGYPTRGGQNYRGSDHYRGRGRGGGGSHYRGSGVRRNYDNHHQNKEKQGSKTKARET